MIQVCGGGRLDLALTLPRGGDGGRGFNPNLATQREGGVAQTYAGEKGTWAGR